MSVSSIGTRSLRRPSRECVPNGTKLEREYYRRVFTEMRDRADVIRVKSEMSLERFS